MLFFWAVVAAGMERRVREWVATHQGYRWVGWPAALLEFQHPQSWGCILSWQNVTGWHSFSEVQAPPCLHLVYQFCSAESWSISCLRFLVSKLVRLRVVRASVRGQLIQAFAYGRLGGEDFGWVGGWRVPVCLKQRLCVLPPMSTACLFDEWWLPCEPSVCPEPWTDCWDSACSVIKKKIIQHFMKLLFCFFNWAHGCPLLQWYISVVYLSSMLTEKNFKTQRIQIKCKSKENLQHRTVGCTYIIVTEGHHLHSKLRDAIDVCKLYVNNVEVS